VRVFEISYDIYGKAFRFVLGKPQPNQQDPFYQLEQSASGQAQGPQSTDYVFPLPEGPPAVSLTVLPADIDVAAGAEIVVASKSGGAVPADFGKNFGLLLDFALQFSIAPDPTISDHAHDLQNHVHSVASHAHSVSTSADTTGGPSPDTLADGHIHSYQRADGATGAAGGGSTGVPSPNTTGAAGAASIAIPGPFVVKVRCSRGADTPTILALWTVFFVPAGIVVNERRSYPFAYRATDGSYTPDLMELVVVNLNTTTAVRVAHGATQVVIWKVPLFKLNT
jgi:hypothetical protein